MRNYNNPFYRTGDISREPKKVAHWLEDFAEKMAVYEQAVKGGTVGTVKTASKTAVEVARERNDNQPSIYEMMSAIVSGTKPKYSSVEEAVKDYQRRTGLSEFQRRSSIEDIAEQIVMAADCDIAEADCDAKALSDAPDQNTGNNYDDTGNADENDGDLIPFPGKFKEKEPGVPNLHRQVEGDEDEGPLAEVIDLFGDGGDDEPPPPSGGSAPYGTLFEVPVTDENFEDELEEAAADDGIKAKAGMICPLCDGKEEPDKRCKWCGGTGMIGKKYEDLSFDEAMDQIEEEKKPSYQSILDKFRKDILRAASLDDVIDVYLKKKSLAQDAQDAHDEQDSDDMPDIVIQNPAVENFIVNIIDTNHGIQVPALLHSLVETFSRDGISQDIFSDRKLLDWINKKLMSNTKNVDPIPAHIGRGVGTQIDYSGEKDSNRDPFVLLVPDKGVFG